MSDFTLTSPLGWDGADGTSRRPSGYPRTARRLPVLDEPPVGERAPLPIEPRHLCTTGYVPPVFRPVVEAALAGEEIGPIIQSILHFHGLVSFSYGISLAASRTHSSRRYLYTTTSATWIQRYAQNNYIEIDPRLESVTRHPQPTFWDQAQYRGRSPRVDAFLDDATAHDVGSGVVMGIRDVNTSSGMITFNASEPILSDYRRAALERVLGDLALFGNTFHDVFLTNALTGPVETAYGHGVVLSSRELEVLQLVIEGLRDKTLAERLEITPRTVQMHITSLREKLGATTREQAVARAIRLKLVAAA